MIQNKRSIAIQHECIGEPCTATVVNEGYLHYVELL